MNCPKTLRKPTISTKTPDSSPGTIRSPTRSSSLPSRKTISTPRSKDAFDEGYDEGFDEGFYDGFYEGYRAGFDDSKNGEKYDPDKRFDEFDEESEETEDTGKETEPEYRKRSYLD